jgi:hypothetical protein
MRHTLYRGCLLATAALSLGGATRGYAQYGGYPVSGLPEENVPIPTGNPGTHGFFGSLEFRTLTMTKGLGKQDIALRGLIDSGGLITGAPGTFIGGNPPKVALNSEQVGRTSWHPGFTATLGYKLDNGVSFWASYTHTRSQTYIAGASLAPQFLRPGVAYEGDLSETFLVSPVFNFPTDYAGPAVKTQSDFLDPNLSAGNFYGIWNGANSMTIEFEHRFSAGELGARVPLLDTDFSRVYGLGGLRYAWFFERFRWRTVSADVFGISFPSDTATYSNTLSQHLYGPFLGCGHEVYLGKRFSVSLDLTGAILLDFIKERAKYKLGDETIQNKRSRNDVNFVPNANADLNMHWYPIEGVQCRVGWTAQTYFNTRYMKEPVAFDYGAIDPAYRDGYFRLVHGLNVGLGLFF